MAVAVSRLLVLLPAVSAFSLPTTLHRLSLDGGCRGIGRPPMASRRFSRRFASSKPAAEKEEEVKASGESCVIPYDDADDCEDEDDEASPSFSSFFSDGGPAAFFSGLLAEVGGASGRTTSGSSGGASAASQSGGVDSELEALILATPILAPLAAFFAYPSVASLYRVVLKLLDFDRAWVPVDGQAYQISILTPTIIGIVVPTITILFATLVSVTVSTLRQRQLDIRSSLNLEAVDLRRLESSLTYIYDALPPEAAARAARSLEQYVLRILGECRSGVSSRELEFTGAADSELSAVGDLLQCFARGDFREELLLLPTSTPPPPQRTATEGDLRRGEGGEGGADEEGDSSTAASSHASSSSSSSSSSLPSKSSKSALELHDRVSASLLVPEALGTVTALNGHRSARLSALQSAFPPIHFAILSLLAISIIVVFLIETDQETLAFLDAVQLKILFSILVGVFTSAAVLISDLQDPFRGSYLITPTIAQIYVIKDTLMGDRIKIEDENNDAVAGADASSSSLVAASSSSSATDSDSSTFKKGGWGGSYYDDWKEDMWKERRRRERGGGNEEYMKSLGIEKAASWRRGDGWNPFEGGKP